MEASALQPLTAALKLAVQSQPATVNLSAFAQSNELIDKVLESLAVVSSLRGL